MKGTADFSTCGKYRYRLTRQWNATLGAVLFVMHNPSTADAEEPDPTVTRCINFAKEWGYGGIVICNLSPYRCTDPAMLVHDDDPIGSSVLAVGTYAIHANHCDLVVLAYGIPQNETMKATALNMLKKRVNKTPHYLRLTKGGYPGHPLYLPANLKPIPF